MEKQLALYSSFLFPSRGTMVGFYCGHHRLLQMQNCLLLSSIVGKGAHMNLGLSGGFNNVQLLFDVETVFANDFVVVLIWCEDPRLAFDFVVVLIWFHYVNYYLS